MAENVEPFLREFQSDAPMIPFLFDALLDVSELFLEKVVKSQVLEKNKSDILKIDLKVSENLIRLKDFNPSQGRAYFNIL